MNDQSESSKQSSGHREPNIPEAWNLKVSAHAIERHRSRSGMGLANVMKVAHSLRNIVAYGREYILKDDVTKVKQLLAHDCQEARYFKEGQAMVVVAGDTIVTSHTATANRWIPKP